MKDLVLEHILKDYFEEMLCKYKWLSIKFEFDKKRGVYLVSYSPTKKITEAEQFMRDSMLFEDTLNLVYGDEAPLFCDEEKYFQLSSKAEVFHLNEEKAL